MKIEPTILDGKIREQIEKENIVQRQYPKKWGKLIDPKINAFYNQNFINETIRKSGFKEICPYKYTGHGDSYFVSKDMYESLFETCRCGRPKSEGHIIKCLQKVKNKYLDFDTDVINKTKTSTNTTSTSSAISSPSSSATTKISSRKNNDDPDFHENIIGLPKNRLNEQQNRRQQKIQQQQQQIIKWNRATYYISPKYTMPGHKIDDHPYSVIFIG